MLVAEFVAQMRKRTIDSEDEPAPTYDGKSLRRSSSDEEIKKDWTIIPMDSLDRATNDQSVSKGAPNEVNASLVEGIPVGGTSVDEIGKGSPSGAVVAPLPPPKPSYSTPSRKRPLD